MTALQRRLDANGTSAAGRSASAANADRIASRVEVRLAALAPYRASARSSSSFITPGAGTVSSTFGSGSVSVPVLSVQTRFTDASDSSAFSCCTSAPRRAMRSAATAKVRLVSRISPSGTIVTVAATAVGTASLTFVWRCQSA